MKMTNKYEQIISVESVLVIIGLSVVLGLAGCQQEGSAEKAGQKLDSSVEKGEQKIEQMTEQGGKNLDDAKKSISDKTEAGGQYIDDAMITANVKTAILNDPLLKVSQIEVTTTNGTVQLSGLLDYQESIDRAVEVAKSQKNVKFVQNNLTINMYPQSEK
ncbi:MAG: BON domain-containing protein [Nitrosomonas sp.]|nr:BON domain-containing protein [Nitrosomonas sp.]